MDGKRLREHSLLLIHGGLAEDMNADRFWTVPGIHRELVDLGWQVLAPDRDTTPESWTVAAQQMAETIDVPTTVVAGSNGVSVGLRLAVDYPQLVNRLVLLWPATAGDLTADQRVPASAAHLLVGETIRGLTDSELSSLSVPVAVMASRPENLVHQRRTVSRLTDIIPGATRIDAEFPEPPHPDFADNLDSFVSALAGHLC